MVILEKEGADGISGEEAVWGEEQSQLGYSRRGEAPWMRTHWRQRQCLIQGDLVTMSLEPQDLPTGIWPPPAPAASVM